ncbi:hypothetical protein Scep_021658 [Stephania cephalantha]|uniref:BHLH domain-containing protein n=1 Tax=Stephania cephalantha TaxID=152367 RepID=A0AAP0FED4_9MAGN
MDHNLINGSSPNFGLAEIWPFSLAAAAATGGAESDCGYDGLRGGFGGSLGGIRDVAVAVGSRNGSGDESTVTEQSGGGGRKRRESNYEEEEEEESKFNSTSSANNSSGCDAKPSKTLGSNEENGGPESKAEVVESNSRKRSKQGNQANEPPKDYIHVRARRGQATDSHSLAERARREKISERMRILQDLVPGCNKVIGKALVLEEIINYIQSLQRQVEFLSMKLEAVNSRTSLGIEGFPLKDSVHGYYYQSCTESVFTDNTVGCDYKANFYACWKNDSSRIMFGLQAFDSTSIGFGSQAREFSQILPPEWLHMQVGGGFKRAT